MDENEERAAALKGMRICRFCLTEEEPLTCIYDKETRSTKHSIPLPLQVMACVSIEVFPNDGMPQMICNNCRQQTMISYKFKTNCKQSDDALKLFLATGTLNKPKTLYITNPIEEEFEFIIPDQEEPPLKRAKLATQTIELLPSLETTEPEPDAVFSIEEGEVIAQPEFIEEEEEESEGQTQVPADDSFQRQLHPDVPLNIFPCTKCERSFPLQQLLDIHIKNHDRERKFPCSHCDKMFLTKYDLAKHMSVVHSSERPYKCIACPKSFARPTFLHRHEKIHTDLPRYLCTMCDRTFLLKEELIQHDQVHKKSRPFSCTQCRKSFAFKQGLERHQEIHNENKAHKCNYCSYSFDSPAKLARHVTCHAGIRPYPCRFCHRSFLLSHHLTRHLRGHENETKTVLYDSTDNYKCTECSATFKRKDGLIGHSIIHSTASMKCCFCTKRFEDLDSIKDHVKSHMYSQIFACLKCNFSFLSPTHLENHTKTCTEAFDFENEEDNPGNEEQNTLFADPELPIEELEEETHQSKEDNSDPIRRSSRTSKIKDYEQFIKDELGSESDQEVPPNDTTEPELTKSPSKNDTETIKPILKIEGTKTYKPRVKKTQTNPETVVTSSSPTKSTDVTLVKSIDLPTKKVTKGEITQMKIGDKMVKVQKLIMSKAEVEEMARQGKIKMKDGAMLLTQPYKGLAKGKTDNTKITPPIATSTPISKPTRAEVSDEVVRDKTETKKFVRTYRKKFNTSGNVGGVQDGTLLEMGQIESTEAIEAPPVESTETLE